MGSEQIENHRKGAEIHHGESICMQKSMELLDEINLPKGLLPLDEIQELGYNRTTGFVWLRQKRKKEYKFRAIGKNVLYETVVTAFVDEGRMRRLTGIKSKELLIWVTISDIFLDAEKMTFANQSGISRTFPVSAFQLQKDNK